MCYLPLRDCRPGNEAAIREQAIPSFSIAIKLIVGAIDGTLLGAALTDIVGDVDGAVYSEDIICYYTYFHFHKCARTYAHTYSSLHDSCIMNNVII